jgi:hypothetical protein
MPTYKSHGITTQKTIIVKVLDKRDKILIREYDAVMTLLSYQPMQQ